MERLEQNPTAAWARVVLAACAALFTPVLLPGLNKYWPVLAGYVVFALALQLLIGRKLGGGARAFCGGVIDLLLVTYFVHLTGSLTSVLISLYLVVVILEAMVAGGRVARGLAVVSVLLYDLLLAAEYFGVLLYAPEAMPWAPAAEPTLRAVLTVGTFFSVLCAVTIGIVARIADRLLQHEAALLTANHALNEQNQRDALTGLFNRRYLFSFLQRELGRAERGHVCAVLMLDLDGFKRANDLGGHIAGDELLQDVGQAILTSVRAIDVVVRYGGDEFAVVLPDTDEQAALNVADRIVDAIRRVGSAPGRAAPVTASLGLSVARSGDTPSLLIARADEWAYVAKQAGGDQRANGRFQAA